MSGELQTKFNVSPGPGLWYLVLGPFGPFGPDLGPGPELDNCTFFVHMLVNNMYEHFRDYTSSFDT